MNFALIFIWVKQNHIEFTEVSLLETQKSLIKKTQNIVCQNNCWVHHCPFIDLEGGEIRDEQEGFHSF